MKDNEKEKTENENAANANSDNKIIAEKHEPMGEEEMEIIQDTDSKLHVQKEVKEEVEEKDESKDNGEEKTENEIKAKQCEVTEQDELKDKEKTENENEAKQKEVAEKYESKDNEEEKTDTGNKEKQDELKGNEKDQSHNEEDTEKIRILKRSITITAKPPMLRGETRAQYMCRLARQLKQRNKSQPTKDEWEDSPSRSDTSSTAASAFETQDLAESIM